MFSGLRTYLTVLIRAKRQEPSSVVFDRERMLTVDSAESVFSRDGKTLAFYTVKPARIRVTPTRRNPDRVNLYRSSGRFGLSIYYYRTNITWLYLANHDTILEIQRDDIPTVRKAMRKFMQNAKPRLDKRPGREFNEYPPPPEKVR